MLGLKVSLYDEIIPTDTIEDVQELVNFLSVFLRLGNKQRFCLVEVDLAQSACVHRSIGVEIGVQSSR